MRKENSHTQEDLAFNDDLTERQALAGLMLLHGNNIKTVAGKMKINNRTVQRYLENLSKRLGCKNMCQLGFKLGQLLSDTTLKTFLEQKYSLKEMVREDNSKLYDR